MRNRAYTIRVFALLLGILFLGAQFHFCADLSASPSGSHVCPVCSAVSTAVATSSPSIAVIPVMNRLEVAPEVVSVFSAVPRALSPRAPPAL